MQTLTAGSFLNLENASTVEALKFTARRLAEASASVVKENLQPASLENLANSLWEKAEYVARETERRRLHQIFVENFSERFRELKPETAEAQKSEPSVSSAEATIKNAESNEQSPAPVTNESGEAESATADENASLSVSPEEAAVVEGKRDEFLGFVESGEPFGDAQATDGRAVAVATAPTIAQADNELAAESSKPEIQSASVGDTDDSLTTEISDASKTKPTADAASAEGKPTTAASIGKNDKNAQTDGKEPFEFEKCTINLNLTLLPTELGKNSRKVIVGATSHNLPPEIDFLEIADGGDLTQIADLIREKLARFRQTLPVKYIEQLRQSKAKSAKKPAPSKATTAATAAPTQPAINQANAAKESGEQKAPETKRAETEKPQSEAAAAEKNGTAFSTAPMPTVNQSSAVNSIQGSLF